MEIKRQNIWWTLDNGNWEDRHAMNNWLLPAGRDCNRWATYAVM